jgi:hypothetical protein
MKLDHVTLLVSSGDGFFIQFLQAKPGTPAYERYGAAVG